MMKNQKGTSLVSVIVSFAVLLIVVLLLQVSITASGRYAARAREVWDQVVIAENHYTNGETDGSSSADVTLKMQYGSNEITWGNLTIKETDMTDTEYRIYYVE